VVNDEAIAQVGAGTALSITGNFNAGATEAGNVDTKAMGDTTSGDTGVGISIALNVANDNALATTKRDLSATGTATLSASTTGASNADAKASVAGGEAD